MPSQDDGGEDRHRGNHNQHDLNVSHNQCCEHDEKRERDCPEYENRKRRATLLSRCPHLIVEWVAAGSIN